MQLKKSISICSLALVLTGVFALSACGGSLLEFDGDKVVNCSDKTLSKVEVSRGNGGETITIIGEGCFKGMEQLQEVVLPASIASIEGSAFYGCSTLTSIDLGNVKAIGDEAFANSGITRIDLPRSLEEIGQNAFYHCTNLTELIIPQDIALTEIKGFDGTGLKSVKFPQGIKRIMGFGGCTELETVEFPDTLEVIGVAAFQNCSALKQVVLPNSLKQIRSGAFMGCASLDSLVIPGMVEVLENETFALSGIERLTVPENITSMQVGALSKMSKVKEIRFESGMNDIPAECFLGCMELESVYFPATVKNIGVRAFDQCQSLKTIYFQGTEEQWNTVYIADNGNNSLNEINVVFNAEF